MARALAAIQDNVNRRLRKEQRLERQSQRVVVGTLALERPGALGVKVLGDIVGDEQFWIDQKGILFEEIEGQPVAALLEGTTQAERLGLAIDFDLVNGQVLQFAQTFNNDWWLRLGTETRNQMRTAIQTHIQSGAPLPVLQKNLTPLFGKARANVIARTEVTRLYAEGNRIAYRSAGIKEVEFQTVRDARVDPDCDGLDKERFSVNENRIVPPIHVRCRCWLAPVELCDEEGTLPGTRVGTKQKCRALTEVVPSEERPLVDIPPSAGNPFPSALASTPQRTASVQFWTKPYDGLQMGLRDRKLAIENIGKIRQSFAEILKGRAVNPTSASDLTAAHLMNLMSKGKPQNIWRGIMMEAEIGEVASSMRVGSTIDMPLSSFTTNRKIAVDFARKPVSWGSQGQTPVMLEIRGGVGADIGEIQATSFTGRHYALDEVVMEGRFRVVSTRRITIDPVTEGRAVLGPSIEDKPIEVLQVILEAI